jgi:RNA recognition motif-containing protein
MKSSYIGIMQLSELLMRAAGAGEVLSCRVLRDEYGQSRGVALSRMDSAETCKHLIDNLNGVTLQGSREPLRVKHANNPSARRFKFLQQRGPPRSSQDGGYYPGSGSTSYSMPPSSAGTYVTHPIDAMYGSNFSQAAPMHNAEAARAAFQQQHSSLSEATGSLPRSPSPVGSERMHHRHPSALLTRRAHVRS